MQNNDGSEFIGGFLHNQTPAQPVYLFDLILQEVERTQIKAKETELIVSERTFRTFNYKVKTTLYMHFRRIVMLEGDSRLFFILRPAR